MHIGSSTIHLGTALATRLPGLVATWLGAVILVHRDIQREEGRLTEQFGAEYAEYAASVPRYPD